MGETINPDGSAVLIESVFYRYGCAYVEEHDTIEEAQAFLDSGEDYGEMSSIGVYVDGEPHSAGPWDWHPPLAGTGHREIEMMRAEYAKAKEADRARDARTLLKAERLNHRAEPSQ